MLEVPRECGADYLEGIFSSDAARNDPRYSPRCYHSRRCPTTSLNDGLARCDRRIPYDLLRLATPEPQRTQPPIGAHAMPFFRQEKLCVVICVNEDTYGHEYAYICQLKLTGASSWPPLKPTAMSSEYGSRILKEIGVDGAHNATMFGVWVSKR
jgi:hypothetical protein